MLYVILFIAGLYLGYWYCYVVSKSAWDSFVQEKVKHDREVIKQALRERL